MHKDLRPLAIKSSFLSCEKDTETILKLLFINNTSLDGFNNYSLSDILKRLLVINTSDCIDDFDNEVYKAKLKNMTLAQLKSEGYIRISPKLLLQEHEEVKSYIIISYDNFVPSANTEFRDNTITFDVICNLDYWDIGDYRLRPIKICGLIDTVLNNTKLSGIGTLHFVGMNELVLDEHLAGYSLTYMAVHETDGDDKVINEV